MRSFFKDLALHARIEAVKAARENQRRLLEAFQQGVHEQARQSLEHVRGCAHCKARIKQEVEAGRSVPFEVREAAGIGVLS